MHRSWKHFAFLLAVGPLLSCATAGAPGGSTGSDADVITLEEIESAQVETAYQLVQQLRPRWMLRNRGDRSLNVESSDRTRVIVDDMPPREFDFLGDLPKAVLLELRFLPPREATMLYGTGFNNGVIKVTTRR